MARPRKQTYTLDMYLNKNRDGDISNDADTQRKPAWKAIVNGLIVTVLTDDYIPPIILAEEENTQLHIADGGSRTAALMMFKHGNYKITYSVEDSIIPYKKKTIDEDGSIVWEDANFNIRGKTYEQLPNELKKKFNEYQIETVIHEDCDKNKIAKYIKRYNEHSSMNTNQKAFTYIDKFANRIRKIMDTNFFLNCNTYSDNDKNKGVVERIIVETMMCMNHFDNWKTQAKPSFKYINEHATEEEFKAIRKVLDTPPANFDDNPIMQMIAKMKPNFGKSQIVLKVDLDEGITDLEKEILMTYSPHFDIGDSSEWIIRSRFPRTKYSKDGVPVRPCAKDHFTKGDILIVNNNYQHYSGEVQIALMDMENDGQRNLVGSLDENEQRLLDFITSEDIMVFVDKNSD